MRSRRSVSASPVDVAIDALATYRVTRLLVSDGVVDRPRAALLERLRRNEHHKLVELIECPWCTGVWAAAAVAASRRTARRWWAPLAEVLAFSAVAGLLASEVREMDETHDSRSDGAGTMGDRRRGASTLTRPVPVS
jgi:hypothetical protein